MATTLAATSTTCAGVATLSSSRLSSFRPAAVSGLAFSRTASKVQRSVSVKAERFAVSAKLGETAQVAQISQDEQTQSQVAKTMAGSLFLMLANAGSAAAAEEVFQLADSDSRGFLLLFVLGPAVGWVLFNILQPALRQFNTMKGAKSVAGAVGLGALASLAAAPQADAAQEIAQLAVDSRPLILLVILGPAVGWVLFNILQPALRQFNNMKGSKSVVGALGLGALATLATAPEADAAQEIAQLAVDSRPLILLFVLAPAIGWVLFNILRPALRQVTNMVEKNSGPPSKRR